MYRDFSKFQALSPRRALLVGMGSALSFGSPESNSSVFDWAEIDFVERSDMAATFSDWFDTGLDLAETYGRLVDVQQAQPSEEGPSQTGSCEAGR